MNDNWPKWIIKGILKHFDTACDDVAVYIEGMPRNTREATSWIEIRVDGPSFTKVSTRYTVDVEVNILIQTNLGSDIYAHASQIGKVLVAFGNIAILDGSSQQIGCLNLVSKLEVRNFGIVNPTTQIQQATVEGKFRMTL